MIRSTALAPLAAASLLALQLPFGLQLPGWAERALWNARERTATGLAAYEAGAYDDAVTDLDRARRLAGEPPPPALDFNAATAHLAAGQPREAVPLLEAAAERTGESAGAGSADAGELAVAARYNLGNAQLAAGDPAAAVEAYKKALRLAPGHADAKYNLELALRRLAESRKPQLEPPRETPGGQGEGEKERSPQGGGDEPSDQRNAAQDRADAGDRGPADRPGGRPEEQPPSPAAQNRPLPGFQDQPDMTAAQAAALLEAVENLEREQRRADAAERARRSATGRKDW